MAGLAAEGLKYDKVIGQSADLFSLQVCSFVFLFILGSVEFEPIASYSFLCFFNSSTEVYK